MQRCDRVLKFFGVSLLAASLFNGSIGAAQESTPIATGDTLTGTLTADVNSLNYDLTAGDKPVLVTATSTDFTPTLGMALMDSSGGGFSVSFDGNVGNPVFIPPLLQGQSAQLQVAPKTYGQSGSFTLSAVAVDAKPIAAGESVDGTVEANGSPQYFSFQSELGKLVTITAQGGAFDTRLKLFAPGSAKNAAADNDGGVGYDPEIYQAVMTAPGTGYIEVAPAFAGDSGNFKLSLMVSEPATLEENTPTLVRLGGQRGTSALTFQGTAGGKAQLSVARAGGDTNGASIAVYQDGVRLIWKEHFDPGQTPSVFQMETKTDSPLYLIITANTSFGEADEGQFEVTLKRL